MLSHVRRIAPVQFPGVGNEDMHLRGTAAVEVVFAESGVVTEVRFLSGEPMMADAVLRSVRTWSFRPVNRAGLALGGCGRLTLDYELTRTKMSTGVR
jgi:outer membrane biosynthesis protein TonB